MKGEQLLGPLKTNKERENNKGQKAGFGQLSCTGRFWTGTGGFWTGTHKKDTRRPDPVDLLWLQLRDYGTYVPNVDWQKIS